MMMLSAGCGILNPFQGRPAAPPVPHIAYVGADDHIYISDVDGSNPRQVTRQVTGLTTDKGWSYRWPTYSPDGRRLAFVGYRMGTSQYGSSAVLVSDVGQPNAAPVIESSSLGAIYLYWSPSSRYLTALFQQNSDLVLYLFDANGVDQARQLLVGQPLYWSWAPDGNTIAVHVGDSPGWVGLLHLHPGDAEEERFGDPSGMFRAPAWSPDGSKLAYATLGGGTSLLSIRDSAGQVTHLSSSTSDLAFIWSPSGDWLAYAGGAASQPGTYRGLTVAHADGSGQRTLSQDPLVAFYWSPDSTRLAVLGLDSAARKLTWSVVSLDGKTNRSLASFLPSTDFAFQIPFFDQYAQSNSVWSADGKHLVYAAADSSTSEHVVVVDADGPGSSQPTSIADGGVAVWSP
jgi:TolB protein